MATNQNQRFYTEDGVEVTDRINKGKTSFFKNEPDAQKMAEKKRSYTYPLFDSIFCSKRNLIGYAVPN